MRESIGNSYLVMLGLTLISLIMLLLMASFVYSKTYSVKNRIVNIMEKRVEYNDETKAEIYSELSKIGYKINKNDHKCNPVDTEDAEQRQLVHDSVVGAYDFCLYRVKTNRGHYFEVTTYTHYDIPAIRQYLNFPIKGTTRTFYEEVGG